MYIHIKTQLYTPVLVGKVMTNQRVLKVVPPLSEALGSLDFLEALVLSNNNLRGSIPKQLGNLKYLRFLYLDHNQLSGEIPKELCLMESLQDLWLSSNQLEGEIPLHLGWLTELQRLRIEENKLTGPIPPELGSLQNLVVLSASGNQLTGSIPKELVHLKKLELLSLSRNQLEGGEGLCLYSNHVGGTWAVLVFPFSRSYSQACSVKEHFLRGWATCPCWRPSFWKKTTFVVKSRQSGVGWDSWTTWC